MNTVYVYGTLRPNEGAVFLVPGILYSLPGAHFPGMKLMPDGYQGDEFVVCEKLSVPDDKLRQFDRYEGYDPNDEARSLYIRRPYMEGWIYEFNHPVDPLNKIPSGDWFDLENINGRS